MFLDSRVKLCKVQDGVKDRPVINFNHLDRILRLKNNLESEFYSDDIFALQDTEENLRDELTRVHQFSGKPEFALKEVTYKHTNPVDFKALNLTKLFDTVLSLLKDKLITGRFSFTNILESNINFLEKLQSLWDDISLGKVTKTQDKPKTLLETPVVLLNHLDHGGFSGTRVIVNPKFKNEAIACNRAYSAGDGQLDSYRRALELDDPRVNLVRLEDRDESAKLFHTKYKNYLKDIENPNWEARAIDYLSQLAMQGKVKDSQGQLLAA